LLILKIAPTALSTLGVECCQHESNVVGKIAEAVLAVSAKNV